MEGIIKFEQIKPVDYEERSIRCLCNSNSSCSVEKRGTHTIALPLPLRALHLRGNDSVPKLKHKDSLKKALMVPFYSLLKQLVAHSLVLSLAEQEEAAEMVDLGLLTDDQLKAKLLQYGLKPGPIVATTRALYEKNLKRLLDSSAQASEHRVNGTRDAGLYSDSEEEDGREEDKNKDSESEQLQVETVARTETSKTARREPVTDVLSEIFPDTAKTPTGIYATKRRPIKGAAGRPVQFKYPEMPLLSPTTLERQEIQQRLVPLWIQIVVFLLVVCLLYLIYSSMEEPLSNPFTALLEVLQQLDS